MTDAVVQIRHEGALTRVTLNRGRALNALTIDMVQLVRVGLEEAAARGSSAVVLDSSDERGFCGGGDVRAMTEGGPEYSREFLREEYATDLAVHTSPVPVVGIMHGITMGGGIGLTGHAAVRVVTETSTLAMPEVRIGITPDVGGHRLLAAAPGYLGELFAITADTMGPGEAIALGFADHFVPLDRHERLYELLIGGDDPAAAVASLAEAAPATDVLQKREWFDGVAASALGDAAEVVLNPVAAARLLLEALEASDVVEARSAAEVARGMSPTSVALTLALIARTREGKLSLRDVLDDDYQVLSRLMDRPDFAEGVRARLIEKDNAPVWSPSRLEALDPAEIAGILDLN